MNVQVTKPGACAVCGTRAAPRFRMPRAEGSPDLDLRPGEPARGTLARWIAVCGGCGAAAPDLSVLPEDAAAIVRSVAYAASAGPQLPKARRSKSIEEVGRVLVRHPEPAFVLVQRNGGRRACGASQCAPEEGFVSAAGDVSLNYALDHFHRSSPRFANDATKVLARLGRRP